MLNIYLCDDNPVILERYKKLIYDIAHQENFMIQVHTFSSGEQLLFHLEDLSEYPDIIYLDVLMGGENGLKIAEKLRRMGCYSEIIFLTSNPEYVFDSFDSAPAHYLIKESISNDRFRDVLLKTIATATAKSGSFFFCKGNAAQMQIKVNDILYFEIRNRIVTVYFNQESFDFYSRLEDVEAQLAANSFIRIHRSYLVHIKYIRQISRQSVILASGISLPLGITYAKQVKLALVQFLNEEA